MSCWLNVSKHKIPRLLTHEPSTLLGLTTMAGSRRVKRSVRPQGITWDASEETLGSSGWIRSQFENSLCENMGKHLEQTDTW